MTDSGPQHVPHEAPAMSDAPAPDGSSRGSEAVGRTGHPDVDEVTESLAQLDALPVNQHVAVFESAHERLRALLASGGAPTAPTA